MNRYFSWITEFGFPDLDHFISSLIRPKLLPLSIPLSVVGGFLEYIFGLEPIILIAFAALLTLELGTGIAAAWLEGQKITSKRMKSFLIMFFVWLVVLFILHQFSTLDNILIATAFDYLFYTTIFFVSIIYLKSVFENGSRIMGSKKDLKKLVDVFDKKLGNHD